MSPLYRPLILNVCANEARRRTVRGILEANGFAVREAPNGAHALRCARNDQPQAVLVDLDLADPFQICGALKAEPATARIPVLHIAGPNVGATEIAQGLEKGAETCLIEPLEADVVAAAIRSAVRARDAVEAAHAMAREWQATFDAISDGLAVADAEGKIRRANQRLSVLTGRPIAELIGWPAAALWKDLGAGEPPTAENRTGGRRAVEIESGDRYLLAAVDPIYDESGALTGSVHIVRDQTEQRHLEEQFRESQKFETIGTLAGGVAHDFNNLLTSVMGNASLLLSSMPEDSPQRDQLLDIVNSSRRAADLTRQLLAYSGKARGVLQKVDLSDVVESSRTLIEAAIPKKVKLDLDLAVDLPSAEADPNQVQQVILNLVSNAAEAIGDSPGVITVRTGQQGNKVCLEVQDTGCGMDAATRARIFDPFFTTKFTGRGLGLSAVAGIVRAHKASIDVESTPGDGSSFRICFPAVAAPEGAARKTRVAAGTGATVLVVDDETLVRRIAEAALAQRGYRVVQATNGLEAIRLVQRNPEIAVVLLDLMMPVMGGEEAIDQILRERPDIKVIVSTGYDEGEALARFRNKPVAGYLHKPYTSRMLAEKVRRALGG